MYFLASVSVTARGIHFATSTALLLAILYDINVCVERRGGVVSESDARPEGRAFESRPIRDARLCSWAKHHH